MKIRFGTFTIVEGIEMKISGNRYEFPIPEDEKLYRVSYPVELGIKDGFILYEMPSPYNNEFVKEMHLKEITNAYFVKTKAIYMNQVFDVDSSIENDKVILRSMNDGVFKRIGLTEYSVGDEKKLSDSELNQTRYFKVHNGFIVQIETKKLSRLWEERTMATYNIPFPEGLELIKELEIPKDI